MDEMNERESWSALRDRRMKSDATRAGYEQARTAHEVGLLVRQFRELVGLSQRELAERMGTTQSVVGRLESGGTTPTLATLERVAQGLGLLLEVRIEDVQGISKRRRGRPGRMVLSLSNPTGVLGGQRTAK